MQCSLTPRNRGLHEKLTGLQLVKKIHHISWNLNVHHHVHKCPAPVSIPSQLHPVHAPTSHFLVIHLNNILPSKPWSSKWFLSIRFPYKNHVYDFSVPHTCYMPRWLYSSRFDNPKKIRWIVLLEVDKKVAVVRPTQPIQSKLKRKSKHKTQWNDSALREITFGFHA